MQEKVINSRKNTKLPLKYAKTDPKSDPTVFYTVKRTNTSKLNENFVDEIRNDKENIKNLIFKKYFRYQNSSFLANYLVKAKQVKKQQFNNQFNKQQKGKGFKILTLKQMLQRLRVALVQVKIGNISESFEITLKSVKSCIL